jgi:hypothetical protein
MKRLLVVLAAAVCTAAGMGCSKELSQAELKKSEEQMQQQMQQMSTDLPAKID